MTREQPDPLVVTDLHLPALDGILSRSADEYLEGQAETLAENATIINLCRSYHYLSKGYYVSLLADARHQRVLPTLEVIEEINNPAVYFRRLRASGIDTIDVKTIEGRRRLLPKVIVPEQGPENGAHDLSGPLIRRQESNGQVRYEQAATSYCEITCVFGKTLDRRFRKQSAAVFKVYALPLLRIRLYEEEEGWKVGQIFPVSLDQLTPAERQLLVEEISTGKRLTAPSVGTQPKPHRIACLWDATDQLAPSDEETIEKFARIAAKRGVVFERITRDDLASLAEYDALFIRTVTAIDHYSFTFAQMAESLGMPVIDDPQSIVRCSNKVYLHELFQRNRIPTPKTLTASRKTPPEEMQALGFPLILKLPDGTFSQAVKKAHDPTELATLCQEMFQHSPLLIAQEFIPTAFDWRVGILEGKVLYVCKYLMAKGHWQIVKRYQSGYTRFGKVEAVRIDEAPPTVKEVALEAAALIGNGLYGVDVKETAASALVIEINDNPNIETECEDRIEKDRIYDEIIAVLLRRIEAQSKVAHPV